MKKSLLLISLCLMSILGIAQTKPIELTGDYKQDMLLITENMEAANRRIEILKNRLELYRKSQVTGYALVITGLAVTALSIYTLEADALLFFSYTGMAVSASGVIVMIGGHKHLKIK